MASAGARTAGTLSAVPDGDLFALANTIEDMVGGRVVIEDPHFKLLAFSRTDNDIDEPRRMTILGRKMPQNWIDALGRKGVFAKMWASDSPVEDPARPEEGYAGRLAIAVKSDREILGSIWVAPGRGPLADHADAVLIEAARVAAPHLLTYIHRDLHPADPSNPTLRDFLAGRTSADVLRRETGASDGALLLAAVAARQEDPDADDVPARLARLASTLAEARGLPALVTIDRTGVVYLMAHAPTAGRRRVQGLLADLATRSSAALHRPIVVAAGQLVGRLDDVPAQVAVATDVLAVLRRPGGAKAWATPKDVHTQLLLKQADQLIAAHRELRCGPVHDLLAQDAEQGTQYVATLRAFFAASADTGVMARRLGIHPNTVRYRLRRIREITGLDLGDPDQRLAAGLYLHASTGLGAPAGPG